MMMGVCEAVAGGGCLNTIRTNIGSILMLPNGCLLKCLKGLRCQCVKLNMTGQLGVSVCVSTGQAMDIQRKPDRG